MSTVLVTGILGFIGSHIQDKLIESGHTVVGIDNSSTGKFENLNPAATLIDIDIVDDLSELFDQFKFDQVFHLAAQINLRYSLKQPQNDAYTNIIGSLNLIENCARTKVQRIIFSSTGGAIYSPDAPLPWTEQSEAVPASPYGISKLTVEKYLEFFYRTYGLKYTALRYSNVFGPRQSAHGEAGVVSILTEKALKNEDLTIFGTGLQTRDFCFVDEVVRSNLLASERGLDGIYNVSHNNQISVQHIAEQILKLIPESTSKIVYGPAIPGELQTTQLSYDKIAKFGWKADISFEDGLKKTVEWYKTNKGK